MSGSAAPMAQRASGLVVPLRFANTPEGPETKGEQDVPRDPDGRKRVVLARDDRRHLVHAARGLAAAAANVVVLLTCRTTRQVLATVKDATTGEDVRAWITEEIPGACGEVLEREDEDGPDPGFGCKCTRIHFVRGVPGGVKL